ncbi:hypothetical protein ACFOOM_18475 [Streptomyces echinoruber]|uniref:Uncharacterized protein n=1 Tax=Streptomyces echinoruber TaxID=68898 RepID=A0A918R5H5_9ACTN|nr:hypothetical protein [Streptomyces echinoruber]GGZ87985.1 hypothetical protein GCM10010389_27770 [Streptomyces echinoruber]
MNTALHTAAPPHLSRGLPGSLRAPADTLGTSAAQARSAVLEERVVRAVMGNRY